VKTFRSLAAVLLLSAVACREKTIDQGALITARTVGLEHLQRGRLPEAEQEFRQVIALAPRDPLGYANLGLTYLRAARYAEAESELDRARRLDPKNPDIALIVAKLYSLTGRPAEARRILSAVPADARVLYALAELDREGGDSAYAERLRQVLARSPANLAVRLKLADALLKLGQTDSTIRYLEEVRRLRPEPPREAKPYLDAVLQALHAKRPSDARAALDRFLRLMEVTAPYQAALAEVDGIEGPLAGRPVLAFSPQSLIAMRGIGSAPTSGQVHFVDVTGETGFPERGASPTALALGDYDGDGEDNLLLAAPLARLYAVHGGFVADVSAQMPLPLPAGIIFATFADYDNDGWLDLFAIGADGRGLLLHNREGKRFDDVTDAAGVRDVDGARHALFVDLDHDGDLDLLLVGGGSLGAYRNNLDGTFTLFPNADGIVQGGTDAAFADVDDDGRTDVFVASATGVVGLFHNDGARGFTRTADTIRGSGPVAVGDYDNDGAIDIFVAGSGLWHNNGSGHFTHDMRSPNLQATSAVFFDYDNDGWLDLFIANGHVYPNVEKTNPGSHYKQINLLIHNERKGRFSNVTAAAAASGNAFSVRHLGRGAAFADFYNDGHVDIVVGNNDDPPLLLKNSSGGGNHFVSLKLIGTRSNRDAIGARLRIQAGGTEQIREIVGGGSYLSQSDLRAHFGLGGSTRIDAVQVSWPSGLKQQFRDLQADRFYVLEEGKNSVRGEILSHP